MGLAVKAVWNRHNPIRALKLTAKQRARFEEEALLSADNLCLIRSMIFNALSPPGSTTTISAPCQIGENARESGEL